MEIFIKKRDSQNTKAEIQSFEILKYTILIDNNTSLLLVQEGVMTVDEKVKKDAPLLEIFKVQFIASCKTELKEGVIVAFYIGEFSCLQTYVLDGLPNNYYQDDNFRLIDYKSYIEICELTGETKLSLSDYIKEAESGNIGVNTLINYNEKFLNHDQQKALWIKLDAKEIFNN